MKEQAMKADDIETLSFKIIDTEAGDHALPPNQWQVVRRMIHTTADFEYLKSVRFSAGAIEAGINAIRQGKKIITDTNMARAGIRTNELSMFSATVTCLIADPGVSKMASQAEITRARAAVDAALEMMPGGIYVIGNAPTALLQLIKRIKEHKANPALVIGLPVGFVNAAESKEKLLELEIPHITNVGRKGGSNVAAAVVNALSIMAADKT